MTPPDLDHLERLARAATAGEWYTDKTNVEPIEPAVRSTRRVHAMTDVVCRPTFDRDGAFIAALNPAVVLAWIAETRRLEAENAALRETLELISRLLAADLGDGSCCEQIDTLTRAALTPPDETQETTNTLLLEMERDGAFAQTQSQIAELESRLREAEAALAQMRKERDGKA